MNYTLEQNDLLVYLAKSDVGHMYDENAFSIRKRADEYVCRRSRNVFKLCKKFGFNYVRCQFCCFISKYYENDFEITNPNNSEATQEQIAQFRNLGFEIDTSELATSDHTIKELLNTSSSTLLVVKVNSDWKVFGLDENGKLKLEDNLQIVDNTTPFSVVTSDGKLENKIPNC